MAHALEKVRDRPPEEAQQLLRQAEGTVLLRLSLSKAGGDRIQVGTVKGKQQITDTLRALLELGMRGVLLLLLLLQQYQQHLQQQCCISYSPH